MQTVPFIIDDHSDSHVHILLSSRLICCAPCQPIVESNGCVVIEMELCDWIGKSHCRVEEAVKKRKDG